jgi:hypothetical protein
MIQVNAVIICDIDENRGSADSLDGPGNRRERECIAKHLVAGRDTACEHGHLQGIPPGCTGEAVRNAKIFCKLGLQQINFPWFSILVVVSMQAA